MANASPLRVEVTYALPDKAFLESVFLKDGDTVQDAIDACGVLEQFPDIDLSKNKVGIFGKAAKLDAKLRPGDRVEIYRPLIADPKEVRRKRAAEGKGGMNKKRPGAES